MSIIIFEETLFPVSFLRRFNLLEASREELGPHGRINLLRLELANFNMVEYLSENTEVRIVAHHVRNGAQNLCRQLMPQFWTFLVHHNSSIVDSGVPSTTRHKDTEQEEWT